MVKLLTAIGYSIRAFLWRQRADQELDEELAFHLERETALYESRGLSRREARREALRHFGGVQNVREECRDVRRTRLLEDAGADVRFALRLVKRDPAFALNVILVSALGICVCATTVSIVSGILLSPLPFASPNRIAELALRSSEGTSAAIPPSVYKRIAAGTPVIEAIAVYEPELGTTVLGGEPERISIERVTPSFFRVFALTPQIGRAFNEQETVDAAPVALLSNDAWHSCFNADPAVLGRTLAIDGKAHTIIGVMPPKFRAHFNDEPVLWMPLKVKPDDIVNALVRLPVGVTRSAADAWLAAAFDEKVASRTASDSMAAEPILEPITELVYGTVQRPLLILLAAVGLVLILISANVATMFLARSTVRERELEVRRALGASGGRELRQLVTEALTLNVVGGLAGIAATFWTVGLVRGLGVRVLPRVDDIALDWRVALFAAGAVGLMGVVGGVVPRFAAKHRRVAIDAASTAERATRSRSLSSALVVSQIALSVVLVIGAGLLVKGFLRIAPDTAGFALDNRATLSVPLKGTEFAPSNPTGARQFVDAMTARLSAVRGVRDVAAALTLPFTGMTWRATVTIPERPDDGTTLRAFLNSITANYFDVMGMPLRAGRSFTSADDADGGRVVIVNETAAAQWWPGQNALGRQFTRTQGNERITATVVGIVRDARLNGRDTKIRTEVFVPIAQSQPSTITFVVRTSADPRSVTPELKRSVWGVVPGVPIAVTDVASITAAAVSWPRFFSTTMSLFASMAVVLSALGIYGLLAFTVAQRRRELGIRIALGASTSRIGRMVLARAFAMGGTGVTIGVLLGRGLSRYMESVLIETNATDARVFAASAASVLALVLIAACSPAYRAIRTDPIESLRS